MNNLFLLLIIPAFFSLSGCSKEKEENKIVQMDGTWETTSFSFPQPGLDASVNFTIDDAYYVGLGSIGLSNSAVQKSFFKFTTEHGWEILKDFPGRGRKHATAFVLEGKAYVGLGLSEYRLKYT